MPLTVRELESGAEVAARATVRFEIYRLLELTDGEAHWKLAARRDVVSTASGIATLRWTFVTMGARYVRARALANVTYAASPWSPSRHYVVE